MQNSTVASTRETLLKDVDNLKSDTLKIANDVKKHATAHVDETKKKINDNIQMVRDQVAAHPFAVLGIGLFVGFLFGLRRRA